MEEFEDWCEVRGSGAAKRRDGLIGLQRRCGAVADGVDHEHLLFAVHTYFALVAKVVALGALMPYRAELAQRVRHGVVGSPAEFGALLHELETGTLFGAAGVENFPGKQPFGWYRAIADSEALRALFAALVEGGLAVGDDAESADALKGVYQSLLPGAVRKALGEFYTPDWLAGRVLDLAGYDGREAGRRVLDPACGSGAFLIQIIGRARRGGARLADVCRIVVGLDVNPLAVLAAKANYLRALGPLLGEGEAVTIPVYQADSITGRGTEMLGARASFDLVVGNPPWVGWQDLSAAYRAETKPLWVEHGLFPHRGMATILGQGRKDLSMLMTAVAADRYLRTGGRLAFVITQAVFKTGGAAVGLRRWRTRGGEPLRCIAVEDYAAADVFGGAGVKAAVVVLEKGAEQAYPVPYTLFAADGESAHTCAAEPVDADDGTSPWLTAMPEQLAAIRKVLGRSDYGAVLGVNAGGANAVYWFEMLEELHDGTCRVRSVSGRARRVVPVEELRLESALLYPLLRPRDGRAWCATPELRLLLVQDVERRRGLAPEDLERYPLVRAWLERQAGLLRQRAALKRYFDPARDPYWSMFNVGPQTLKPWKVVWPRMAETLRAAVVSRVDGRPVIPQETMSFIGLEDPDEAHFVAGVLNSTPFRAAVAAFSQPQSKSFGTPGILRRARVPRYDPARQLHVEIANRARELGARHAASQGDLRQLDALCALQYGLSEADCEAFRRGGNASLVS